MYLLKKRIRWAFLLTLLFIVINTIAIASGQYLLNLIPLTLVIIAIAFIHLDWIFFAIVFLVPLSVQLKFLIPDLPFDLFLPTEPLLTGVLLIMIFKLFYDNRLDNNIINHPVTFAIFFNLLWMTITTITSTMPLVSAKYLLVRIWFLATFYFLAILIFRQKKFMLLFWWLYIVSFSIVIVYTLSRHATFGLDKFTVYFAMKPFFRDHTIYGADLAMFIPVLFGMAVLYYRQGNLLKNTIIWLLTALFLVGIVFSYTRAAWISVAGALIVFLLVLLRIRFWVLLSGAIMLIGLFFAFQSQVMMKLEKNKQDSSTDLAKHLQSIPNIASDASNRERINRWNSAIRMFKERPVFGFGPGTYQFQYAPYQKWYEKTIISTNFGTLGNAHSEYVGPLAESGFPGTLAVLAIMILTVFTALRVYYHAWKLKIKVLALASLLGLITYYIHGLMNNFLDSDKISAPFWGFTAIIVALDIYHREKDEEVRIQA